jgi:N-methylhydantoinase A
MADGVRVATVRRGVDPRNHALLAFGGAAGLHVTAVAGELGVKRVVVPIAASVLSAWGMLNTDLRVELTRGQSQSGGIDIAGLTASLAQMEQEGRARLSWFDGEIIIRHSADMRYGEQVFEINVPLDGVARDREAIEDAFHASHERLYTYALRDQDVVLVNAGVSVIGRLPAAPVATRDGVGSPSAAKSRRQVFLGGWTEVPVYDFATLAPRQEIEGPLIVESDTTTVLLRNEETARFDPRGWLDIALR